jgi:hypothetical protein
MKIGQRISILYNTLIRVAEIFTKLTGRGASLRPLNGEREWDMLVQAKSLTYSRQKSCSRDRLK